MLIQAMKANGLQNFGAPFAKPDTSWDAVRSSQPLLAERSDKELYDATLGDLAVLFQENFEQFQGGGGHLEMDLSAHGPA